MKALGPLKPPFPRSSWVLVCSRQCRGLHRSRVGPNRKKEIPRLQPQRPSLFDELFPQGEHSTSTQSILGADNIPRLPIPEADDFFEESRDDLDHSKIRQDKVTTTASAQAFRHQNLAVLALHIASKSLIESDFRRVAPKGKHIDEWTGPGDILKVIPGRDPKTLEQATYYFILFPNPAYARTYQSHVVHLHRVAKTHTPTSIESPLPLQPGVIVEGEDAYTLLQDYALCPPSQRLQLKLMYPSSTPGSTAILQRRGYPQLVDRGDKTGRSVLFNVNGQQVTTHMVRNTIAADGRQRGLAWNVSIEKLDISPTPAPEVGDFGRSDYDNSAELKPQSHFSPRWILSFEKEDEARRFIRTWHQKQFPTAEGDRPRLIHAKFLW